MSERNPSNTQPGLSSTGIRAAVSVGGHLHAPQSTKELTAISLAALGVVYGDIGTSPLYAMKECLITPYQTKPGATPPAHLLAPSHLDVMGVVSLVFWALTLVVVIKYLVFVLRADNKGEGGILALAALVLQRDANRAAARAVAGVPPEGNDPAAAAAVEAVPGVSRGIRLGVPILLALFGAGLLYGDGVITPAISVLGAVEGIGQQSPALKTWVVPITVIILVLLFLVQRVGTHRIGSVFGWVMLVWFLAIGAIGVPHILSHPGVLAAANPLYAVHFFMRHGWHGFLLLGAVVLVVTGGEALYADMGHFGRLPIRVAWYAVVFPGLLLNYFGQGAMFLERAPGTVQNPFYDMVPQSMLIPMIVLATAAAVIASQALISGAFSLTHQAVQLGYLPRVTVIHTSHKSEGQIYVPQVNYALMVACVLLVLQFGSADNLAAAYGIAVTGTMAITSYLYYLVCRDKFGYRHATALALFIPMIAIDLSFLVANSEKIAEGGWFPLAVGVAMFVLMTTWWRGRLELAKVVNNGAMPDLMFIEDIAASGLPRVPGIAVFMASSIDGIPNVLLHHVKHNKVLHKQVVLLSIVTENVPFVVGSTSIAVRDLGHGFFRVVARVGFMQRPNVPRFLARAGAHGLAWDESDATYYLGRQTLITTGSSSLAQWRKILFSFMTRNARPPTDFFQLPPNRVVELGLQIEL